MSAYLNYLSDKLGDATLYVLDEFKFWGEVIIEFLELDESSSERHLNEMKERVREQIDETEEYQKEVDKIKEERKKMGIVDEDEDESDHEEVKLDE
jgi:hypothetical protein